MLRKSRVWNFTASNGLLEKTKVSYDVRERKVNGEPGEVAEYTVSAWMERLVELTWGYELADILNIDETGCFFMALPEKGLAEKKSQARGGKMSKTRLTVAFFVNTAGEKLSNHWWCSGVKNHIALKTLRVYPDNMAFITTPVWKHGWLQNLLHQFWTKLIDRGGKLLRGKFCFLWITHRAILKV